MLKKKMKKMNRFKKEPLLDLLSIGSFLFPIFYILYFHIIYILKSNTSFTSIHIFIYCIK